MEIVRLGVAYSTDYVPDLVVENLSEIVWTERFLEPGEFEFKTPNIEETLAILPEMTLVSHRETADVMMVETHEIQTDENGNHLLSIRGRSVDAFLEHRHVESSYGKKRKMAKNYSPRGAAAVLLWNAIDNPSEFDVTRDGSYPVPGRDQIPNVMVTDSANGDDSRRWWLEEGPLYPQLIDILTRYDIGLRIIRPSGTNGTRVKVLTSPAERGNIERTYVTNITALRFDLFQGIDRSHLQSGNERVAFNTLHGDILSANYLFSVQNFKTACEIMSGAGGSDQYRNNTEQNYTGWRRRVMSHDAGEPEYPDGATNAQKSNINDEFRADAETDALRALKRNRRVKIISGDISPQAPYQYKVHYNLGDTVSLFGDYGQVAAMVVSEYIRTQDADGDRGYPGLVVP